MSLGEVFMLVWQNVLSPVFGWFGDIAVWLWENAIQPVFGFISSAFQAVGTAFMWVWENVLSPVFTWFFEIAVWLGEKDRFAVCLVVLSTLFSCAVNPPYN